MTTEYKPPAKLTPQRLTSLAAAHRMYEQHDKVLSSACALEEISSLATELKAAREALCRVQALCPVGVGTRVLSLKINELATAALEGIPEETEHGVA